MHQGGRIRVFLLDDHEIVRRGVRALLEAEPDIEVVGESGTASDALPEILRLRPDVALLEAVLRDGSGIEVCRQMRVADPSIRGMVLTSHEDEHAIGDAIVAGAAGYVLKRIDGTALVSGVRLVAGGHSLIDPAVAARVVQQVQVHRRTLDLLSELTPQQSKILMLIAEGLTNRQIAGRLFLAEKTVKNHVTGLLARLGVEHRTQAAVLALRLYGEAALPVPAPRPSAEPRVPSRGAAGGQQVAPRVVPHGAALRAAR